MANTLAQHQMARPGRFASKLLARVGNLPQPSNLWELTASPATFIYLFIPQMPGKPQDWISNGRHYAGHHGYSSGLETL